MSKITIDADTIAKLGGIKETTVLYDAQGNKIGVINPFDNRYQMKITEEELQRRIKNPGKTYTTEEVLKHLENLGR
jgi:hypothetical protein